MSARTIEQDIVDRTAGAQLARNLRGQVAVVQCHGVRVAQQQAKRSCQLFATRSNRIKALAERRRNSTLDVHQHRQEAGGDDASQVDRRQTHSDRIV